MVEGYTRNRRQCPRQRQSGATALKEAARSSHQHTPRQPQPRTRKRTRYTGPRKKTKLLSGVLRAFRKKKAADFSSCFHLLPEESVRGAGAKGRRRSHVDAVVERHTTSGPARRCEAKRTPRGTGARLMVLVGLDTGTPKAAAGGAVLVVGPLVKAKACSSETARFDWLVGDYRRATPTPDVAPIDRAATREASDDDIEAELEALHQARGTLAIVARRARERLGVPGFAPDRSLQKRTLDQLDLWAAALQRREAYLGAEWCRRHPLPHRVGPWRRLCAYLSGMRRRRPTPSTNALA